MIKVNPTNSILIKGELFITNLKATRVAVEKSLRKYLNYTNKVKHPKFGEMIQYTGFYNRNIIHLQEWSKCAQNLENAKPVRIFTS